MLKAYTVNLILIFVYFICFQDNFCTLKHLVKIDLSKNELSELPEDFGALQNLQHLDLLGNKLVMLPVSFYQLRKLKWLDLKDNLLVDDLKKVAGDCLDEDQCKKCAQRVSVTIGNVSSSVTWFVLIHFFMIYFVQTGFIICW